MVVGWTLHLFCVINTAWKGLAHDEAPLSPLQSQQTKKHGQREKCPRYEVFKLNGAMCFGEGRGKWNNVKDGWCSETVTHSKWLTNISIDSNIIEWKDITGHISNVAGVAIHKWQRLLFQIDFCSKKFKFLLSLCIFYLIFYFFIIFFYAVWNDEEQMTCLYRFWFN